MGRTQTRVTVGKTGDITETNAALKAADGGFGVFGYYTKNTVYAYNQSAFLPNFMYNQKVSWISSKWDYTPVKYWPNGLNDLDGGAGGDDATLTAGGKVSFFAYAPYVATTTITGATSSDEGIVGISTNSLQGNPTITYQIPSTGMVDLLWGTANTSGTDLAGNDQPGTTLDNHTITNGGSTHYKVNADLTKQQIDGAVKFNFIHALSKVGGSTYDGVEGGLQIMLDIDALSGGAEDNNTKVTVKEIKINTDYNHNGDLTDDVITMYKKGTLDLATGIWTISSDAADRYKVDQLITTAGTSPESQLNPDIAEPTTTVDEWSDLSAINGVKIAKKNVYASGLENSPLLFIPGTTPKLQFTITYYVRTLDTNLAAGYSEVQQTVSKTVTFANPVLINKKYNFIIHLGLTSVKFEATVANWSADIDDDSDVDANDQTVVNLPLNVN